MMQLSSVLLQRAVEQISRLPGVGAKTALRHALHLLRGPEEDFEAFLTTLQQLKENICYCSVCHNISDTPVCPICSDARRDTSTICVVENIQDVMAIENTMQYHGLYHVLGGLISPMNGITPSSLEIDSLCQRIAEGGIKEVIFALASTMEGDTTAFYIYRKLSTILRQAQEQHDDNQQPTTNDQQPQVKFSCIARGISVGDELEYTDELTLGRSITNRTNYDGK